MFPRFRNLLASLAVIAALAVGAFTPQAAQAQAFSDNVENKLIDAILRGQTVTFPTTLYVGLSTTACTDSSFGTEVTGNNYSRASVAASLTNFSGTQSSGSTVASTGSGGVSSNNNSVPFPTPSGSWGTVTHWFIADSAAGTAASNLWVCAALTQSKVINGGDTVSFASGALSVTVQ
jgi:hypothetical protein